MSDNPYVHPDEKNNMLNRAGYDGHSFDDKDDEPSTVDDVLDFTSSYDLPEHVELIFTGDAAEYDLPEIVEELEKCKTDKKYGTEPISAFNLSHGIASFGTIDWSNYPNSRGMREQIEASLAEAVARAEMNSDPDRFSYEARAADIGEGELLSRRIREYRGTLHSGDYLTISDKAYDISLDLSDNMNRWEWEQYIESVYNDDMHAEYDKALQEWQAEQDPEEVRARIFERENIDPKTPDRDLPWYITDELEKNGVSVDYGE